MKRTLAITSVFCLLAGLLMGGILPMPWDAPALVTVTSSTIVHAPTGSSSDVPSGIAQSDGQAPLNSNDNFPLLNTACYLIQTLRDKDYAAFSAFVHPEKGVTFTPYSTVDFETDRTFTQAQVRDLEKDDAVYTWGYVDGRGSLINLTMAQYFQEYVFNTDYTQAAEIGLDRIMMSGNALENLTEAYPGCRFVDFCIPGAEEGGQGLDWCSLKLVFEPGESNWLLVGIVHGQWTV